jgi:hypothetical protein
MVIFDVATSFLVAGAIGHRSSGTRPDLALAAGTLGIGPAGMAFLALYPDWDWQYLLEPASVPTGFSGIFLLALGLAALAGHWVGARHLRALWGALGVFLLYVAWSVPRVLYVGTYAEYMSETAPFLPTPFLVHIGLIGGASAAIMAWCIWRAGPAKT